MYSAKKPLKTRGIPKKWMLVSGVILVVILALVVLEVTNTTNLFGTSSAPSSSGSIPSTVITPDKPESSQPASSPTPSNTTGDTKVANPTTVDTNAELPSPSGTFVSNHNPHLSNSATAGSSIESQCTTIYGATCYLEFTKDGVTRSLTKQTAGASGVVYWSWDIKTAGLDVGSWKVTAISSIGSQTKSASDPIAIKVDP